MPAVVSIQVGLPRWHGTPGETGPMDRPYSTGFFKEPVAGPVRVGRTNIAGDGQADLSVHGGPDKAVLAYSAEHYPAWRVELGLPDLPFGAFGENLSVGGLTEDDVCIGDIWTAGEVAFEASQPRQPCWKLARRWRLKTLPALVVETGRSGWYFRVRTEGELSAGAEFTLTARPNPTWTITRANGVMYGPTPNPALAAELAHLPELAMSWRETLLGRG